MHGSQTRANPFLDLQGKFLDHVVKSISNAILK
jgi:hypothetical protein